MKKEKPNVIFILTDDQGYWSLGCYGNKEIRTPNIDKLAATGVRFENYFCVSPVCSPARASLLTGRLPSAHGIHDWIRGGNGDTKNDPNSVEYLEGITGYTDLMVSHNYVCGQSGKWHMGATDQPQKGYSHWFTTCAGGGTYHDAYVYRGTQRVQSKGYLTDVICDDAIDFITERCAADDGKPFYLNVAFTAPHSPHVDQHKEEYVDYYYEHCSFDDVRQDPRHPWSPKHPVDIQFSESHCNPDRKHLTLRDLLSGYYAAVQGIDDAVGRIVATLEKLGIRDNTIIAFMTDNGFACGQHGIWGKGNSTQPLNLFDTSIKVPCIFNGPKFFKEGITSDVLASGYDFMPTLLELIDIQNPEASSLPGRSLVSILQGEDLPEDDHFVTVFDEYGYTRMIRTKEWKYVHRYLGGPNELYDLVHDPLERFNVLEENRFFAYGPDEIEAKRNELLNQLEEWFHVYSKPEFDGKLEPVGGRGQRERLTDKRGEEAFFPWLEVEYPKS